jgi:hypothetical protein
MPSWPMIVSTKKYVVGILRSGFLLFLSFSFGGLGWFGKVVFGEPGFGMCPHGPTT